MNTFLRKKIDRAVAAGPVEQNISETPVVHTALRLLAHLTSGNHGGGAGSAAHRLAVLVLVGPPDNLAEQRPVGQGELTNAGHAWQVDVGKVNVLHGGQLVGHGYSQLGQHVLKSVDDTATDGLHVGDGERSLLELLEGLLDRVDNGVDSILDRLLDVVSVIGGLGLGLGCGSGLPGLGGDSRLLGRLNRQSVKSHHYCKNQMIKI